MKGLYKSAAYASFVVDSCQNNSIRCKYEMYDDNFLRCDIIERNINKMKSAIKNT